MFNWTLIKRSVGMTFMVGGLFLFGMKGFLVGIVIYNWFCYFVNIGLVSKYIGYHWKQQLLDLMPTMLVSSGAALVCWLLGRMLHLGMYADGGMKLLLFAVIYLCWSFIFKPESFNYFLSVIPDRFRIWERHGRKELPSADI